MYLEIECNRDEVDSVIRNINSNFTKLDIREKYPSEDLAETVNLLVKCEPKDIDTDDGCVRKVSSTSVDDNAKQQVDDRNAVADAIPYE